MLHSLHIWNVENNTDLHKLYMYTTKLVTTTCTLTLMFKRYGVLIYLYSIEILYEYFKHNREGTYVWAYNICNLNPSHIPVKVAEKYLMHMTTLWKLVKFMELLCTYSLG